MGRKHFNLSEKSGTIHADEIKWRISVDGGGGHNIMGIGGGRIAQGGLKFIYSMG